MWTNPVHKCQYERKWLFIDERPKFFDTASVTRGMFQQFIEELVQLERNEDWRSFKEKGLEAFSLFPEAEDPDSISLRIKTHLFGSTFSELALKLQAFAKTWWSNYEGANPEYLNAFIDFFSSGGSLGNNYSIVTYRWTDYRFQDYSTVILDGTAKDDMSYPSYVQRIDAVDDFRRFDNVTIHHSNERNLSKRFWKQIRSNSRELRLFKALVKDVATTGKTLVVTFKDFGRLIGFDLKGINNIELNHFNNLKGSNKYKDCVNLIFLGTQCKTRRIRATRAEY